VEFQSSLPPQMHDHERQMTSENMRAHGLSPKTAVDWRQPEPLNFFNDGSGLPQLDDHAVQMHRSGKHPRNWDHSGQLQSEYATAYSRSWVLA